MSIKIKTKKSSSKSVKLFNPYQPDYKHELLNGTLIDLNNIEGFDDLNDTQKRFLYRMSMNNLKEAFTLMESGIKRSEYKNWTTHDPLFIDVLNHIKSVHYDSLEEVDYKVAHNGKQSAVRGRVFQRKVDPVRQHSGSGNGSGGGTLNAIFMGDDVAQRGLAAMKDLVSEMKDRGVSLNKLTPDPSRQKIQTFSQENRDVSQQ